MIDQFLSLLIHSSWQLLVLVLIVWPLSRLSIRAYPNFAYMLWVIILIKALLPISFTLPTEQIPVMTLSPVITGDFIQALPLESSRILPLNTILALIWMIGITFLSVKLLLSEITHRKQMQNATLLYPEDWFIKMKMSMKIRQKVSLYMDANIQSPLMQGLWKVRIYLPLEFETWTAHEKQSVLAHELTHVKRFDIIIIYLQAIVKTLYFFHPAVWLVNDQIDLEREKICDDVAIDLANTDRGAYGEQLFRQLSSDKGGKSIPVLAGGFFMSDSSLIKRFRYIKEKRGNMTNKLRSYHVLLVLLVVSLAVLIACSSEYDPTMLDPPGLTKETTDEGLVAYDSPPSPVGGFAAIQDNVIYPDLARQAGIGGTTIVQVTVNRMGEAVNPEVLRSSGTVSLDAAAMNAATVTSWVPAMKDDAPVRVRISLPVTFRLSVDSPEHAIETANMTGKQDWDMPPKPKNWKHIGENIVYPEEARQAGISGTVTLQFTIDKAGNLIDPKVTKGPDHPALKEAAVKALKSTAWSPAEKDGKPISSTMEMGIGFDLAQEQSTVAGQAIRPVAALQKVPVKIKGADAAEKAKQIYYDIFINADGEFEAIRGSNSNSDEGVEVNKHVLDQWMSTKWVVVSEGAELQAQWVKIPLDITFTN